MVSLACVVAGAGMIGLAVLNPRKHGGIWFARVGRIRLSFCFARKAAR